MMTQLEKTIGRLHQALDKLPARIECWLEDAKNYDWNLKFILADALEEVGSPIAPGYRWMAKEGKRPIQCDRKWRWFLDLHTDVGVDPNSDLPRQVFQRLGRSMIDRRTADDAVALVIAKLIDEGIEIWH